MNFISCNKFYKFFLLLLFLAAPNIALSDITSFTMEVINDGLGPFDAADVPGDDSSATNNIVRTHDEVRYRFTIGTDGGDTNVVFTATIPDIPTTVGGVPISTAGGPLGVWRIAPPQCLGPATQITNGGRTLICDIGDVPNPTSLSVQPVLDISAEAPNGAVLSFLDGTGGTGISEVVSDQTPAQPPVYLDFLGGAVASLDETVSAAPRFDLVLGRSYTGNSFLRTYFVAFQADSGPPGGGAGVDGVTLSYNLHILARKLKGSEMLEPSNDIRIVDDLSNLINGGDGGALAIDWLGPATDVNLKSITDACTRGPIAFFGPYEDSIFSTDSKTVSYGGDCIDSQPGGSGSPVELTISGSDSSLNHYPTLSILEDANFEDLSQYYIVSKTLGVWAPMTDINPVGVINTSVNRIDFDSSSLPLSISGQANVEPDLANNELSVEFTRVAAGSFSKTFTPENGDPPQFAEIDPRILNDNHVNHVSPGQLYRTRILLRNLGSEDLSYDVCDKIDNSRQVVVPGSAPSDFSRYGFNPPFLPAPAPLIEWGVRVGDGAGGVNDSWINYTNQALESDGGNELPHSFSASYYSFPTGSTFTDTDCPDADPSGNTLGAPVAYFTSLSDVLAAGYTLDQVTMVRMIGTLGASQLVILGFKLQAREFFAYDANDVATHINGNTPSGFTYSYNQGDPIPLNSHIPNALSLTVPELGIFDEIRGDVLEFEFTRFVSVKKEALPAAGAEVSIGDEITYIITPNYSTPALPTSGDVIVEDILPPGLSYSGTTSGPGTPVVLNDTPSTDYTTLRWSYVGVTAQSGLAGDPAADLAPIVFTASVEPFRLGTELATGDSLVNWVSAYGENPTDIDDGKLADCTYDFGNPLDPDDDPGYAPCEKDDFIAHTVNSPAGIVIYKQVLTPIEEVGQEFDWRLNWAVYQNFPPPDLNIIEILPFNGDGSGGAFNRVPPSSFSGTTSLSSVAPANDLVATAHNIYVTSSVPLTINEDPQDPSNLNPGIGASIWCLLSNVGTIGCPPTLASVTAVLVEHTGAILNDELYSLDLSFQTSGNVADDIYSNTFVAGTITGGLPSIESDEVTATVVDSSLGSLVWLDYDGDGVQGAGEPGMPGISVTLHNASTGVLLNSEVTGALGDYLFSPLPSSDAAGFKYEVRIDPGTLPAFLTPVFDLDGANTPHIASEILLGIGVDRTDVNFAYRPEGSISVTKTLDSVYSPPGTSWIFTLSTTTAGCVLPTGLTNPQATVDGSGGTITFLGLQTNSSSDGSPCQYTVTETAQSGWVISTSSDPMSGLTVTNGNTTAVSVINETDGTGSIGDFVWLDANGNGTFDTGDSALSGVTVNMTYLGADNALGGGDDVVFPAEITSSGGAYLFDNLINGRYLVQINTVSLPLGSTQTFDPDGTLDDESEIRINGGNRNDDTVDFAYQPPLGSVGDLVFADANNNGVFDGGDTGLSGVTVNLTYLGVDGVVGGGDDGTPVSEITNGTGNYSFDDIFYGNYLVEVVSGVPAAYTQSADPDSTLDSQSIVTVDATTPNLANMDFGYVDLPEGQTGNSIWEDIDGDGVQDAGETGLAAVTVTLTYFGPNGVSGGGDDIVYPVQVTTSSGAYLFTGLPQGNFQLVTSTIPTGYSQTVDPDGTLDNTSQFTLTFASPDNLAQDFAYEPPKSTVGDLVFDDANNNGVFDTGDTGLVGVTVNLTYLGANGVVGGGDDGTPVSEITNGSGNYQFADVLYGNYLVEVVSGVPAAYTQSADPDSTLDSQSIVTVDATTPNPVNMDFGYVDLPEGQAGNSIWEDIDGDGVQDAGETGLAAVTVTLTYFGPNGVSGGGDDIVYPAQVTTSSGAYLFTGLPQGNFQVVTSTIPTGYSQTVDPDGTLDNTSQFTLTFASPDNLAQDFAYEPPKGTVGDLVFDDANNNGVFDTGDAGLIGVTVNLTYLGANGVVGGGDDGTPVSEITNGSGNYQFADVLYGNYLVEVASGVPAAYTQSADPDSTLDGQSIVTVDATTPNPVNMDFGYVDLPEGQAGNSIWEDKDGDGVQDAGETGLAAVTVTLTYFGPNGVSGGGDDIVYPAQVTTSSGVYLFTGLPQGNFEVVTSTIPTGYSQTVDPDGTLDNTSQFTLTFASPDNLAQDFAYEPPKGTVGDLVFDDANNNGVFDTGDAGLVGVTVNLTYLGANGVVGGGDDGTPVSEITNGSGNYQFADVLYGNYLVEVVSGVPAAYTQSADPDSTLDGQSIVTVDATTPNPVNMDFGYVDLPEGQAGNSIWEDIDGDGVQDAGETGLAAVTVTLTYFGPDGVVGGGDDIVYPAQVTTSSGAYLFTGLPQGNFQVVTSTIPTGYSQTVDPDGTLDNTSQFTLTFASPDNLAQDFAYEPPKGTVGDLVFDDANNNGVFDTGDAGLVGVTVNLTYLGANGVVGGGDDGTPVSEITNGSGNYQFTDVLYGNYLVEVVSGVPAAYTQSADPDSTLDSQSIVTVDATTPNPANMDFGYVDLPGGVVGDLVFNDIDGDGIQDAGETGLAGITVTLTYFGPDGVLGGGDDIIYPAQVTTSTGNYSFINLPQGNFQVVTSTIPAGYSQTLDPDGTLDNTSQFTLTFVSPDNSQQDFAYEPPKGTVGDLVFDDVNNNGVFDIGDAGLLGVTVNLTYLGANGVVGGGDDGTPVSEITNGSGNYQFTDVLYGNYLVEVVSGVPAAYTQSADPDSTLDNQSIVTVDAITPNPASMDFGYVDLPGGVVGDLIFNDINGDGIQDAGETGLAGITVTLTYFGPDGVLGGGDDIVYPTQVTTGTGSYSFTSLPQGNFQVVTSTIPAGYSQTLDPDGTLDNTSQFTLTFVSPDNSQQDFAYEPPKGTVGDLIFDDANNSGLFDSGDTGLSGVTVNLTYLGANGIPGGGDDGTPVSEITNGTGNYQFTDVLYGNYLVEIVAASIPAGYTQSADPDSTLDSQSIVTISAITENPDTYDFGYIDLPEGSVGDLIFDDTNGDGIRDLGEPGLSGVTVTLTNLGPDGALGGGDDTVYPAQVTTASGGFLFTGIPQGDYQIETSTIPAGYTQTLDPDGILDNTSLFTLDFASPDNLLQDFAFEPPKGSIGDLVFDDVNNSTTFDAGDAGLSGITVNLTYLGLDGAVGGGDDGVPISQVTNVSGLYSFTDLLYGNYLTEVLSSSLPVDYIQTYDLDSILDNQTIITVDAVTPNPLTNDFGYFELPEGSVGDTVWDDLNGDGIQDIGEPGLPSVTVTLTDLGADGVLGGADDTIYPTETTDSSGNFLFTSLPQGTYFVELSNIPADYTQTFDPDGTLDNGTTLILTTSSPSNLDIDFAYEPSAGGVIGSSVWEDINNNGIQDSGEAGVSGVSVVLTYYGVDGVPGGGDDEVFGEVTDTNGNYSFTSLAPGEYEVAIDPNTFPAGLEFGYDYDGGEDGRALVSIDSAFSPVPQQNFGLVLSTGEATVLWNGFCDQQNFVSLRNTCSEAVTVDINLFGSVGESLGAQSVLIGGGDLLDFSINAMPGFSIVNYGVAQLISNPGGCISGDMGLFAPIGMRGQYFTSSIEERSFGDSSVLFTLSDGSQSNACYLTYNTFQPSNNPEDASFVTTHWLQLANKESEEKLDFNITRFDSEGSIVSEETAVVNPFGRQDIAAGHEDEVLNRFGLIEVSPNRQGLDYLAQLYRYGVDSRTVQGLEMSSFNLAENCSAGLSGEQYVTLSKGAGVKNWLELYNINKVPVTLTLKVYSNTQGLVREEELELASMASIHIDAAKDFIEGESGVAEIVSTERVLVKSTSYLYDQYGSVVDAVRIEGKEKLRATSSSSFNTYRNQLNWLRLFNASSDKVEIIVSAYSQQNEQEFGKETLNLQPYSGIDYDLNGRLSLSDSNIGRVELKASELKAILADIIRVQHGYLESGEANYSSAQAFEVFGFE